MSNKLTRFGLALAVAATVLFTYDNFGASRSSGSSGSRSSSSSSRSSSSSSGSKSWGSGSRSTPSTPAPSKPSTPAPAPAPKKSFGSAAPAPTPKAPPATAPNVVPKAPAPQKSATDIAVQQKAVKSGTTYKTRDEAVTAFKTQNATKYPSKYSSEPSTRPAHIPRTTVVNGSSHTVIYNSGYGGYGYFIGPTWYPYNPMMDMAMLSVLMANSGPSYHYHTPAPASSSSTTVHTSSGGSGWTIVIALFSLVVLVAIVGVFFVNRS